jgi:FdrA protein
MTTIRNEVRRGTYLDSVALMRMSRTVAGMDGVIECGMMMATPANKRIMADAGVLGIEGDSAGPGDLVIAVSAQTVAAAHAALAAAKAQIDAPKTASAGAAEWAPRSIRAAVQTDPSATLALISVPGAFAAAEGRKALSRGLNVMMFSDNVPISDELALKQLARDKGLLMMGPDCGTAIINGTPLGFANVVPRGSIGIIGASGTGIQEVSCLIANNGGGISHAIGTGGRDLKAEVGGITTLMAIDLLDADPATRHVVIISKPPADDVAAKVLERVGRSKKTFTVCFLGTQPALPINARPARTLEDAAFAALGKSPVRPPLTTAGLSGNRGRDIRGLFCGGTLAAEAQIVLLARGLRVASNAPVPGSTVVQRMAGTIVIDLGDDELTQGRPHPMIEPGVRDAAFDAAVADENVGVLLFDIVLGHGGHADPAGHLVSAFADIAAKAKGSLPVLVCSVTGTAGDPQQMHRQIEKLEAISIVCASNADAANAAYQLVSVGRVPPLS